jgi:trehalose 6-phosphate phosphatase
MKHLLGRENVGLLGELSWSKILLGFDFDGTLAPIVEHRDAAAMTPTTARLFAEVAARYPCAVISGRSRSDVTSRLAGAKVKYIIGNHGLEPSAGLGRFASEMARAKTVLEGAFELQPGIEIEDKRYSLAVHYRRARVKADARRAIAAAVAPLGMRVIPGKLVVNLVPAGAPSKADALLELRATERADVALYVGDDVTDEDVFEIDEPGRLVSVRVGASKSSAARYFLKRQSEIDVMLRKLAEARAGAATPRWVAAPPVAHRAR